MTEREALKLALEALVFNQANWQGKDKAITAIKEALAQPEPWEKFCDSNCVWTDHHPDCKLAEQSTECGEPVAWMHVMDNTEGIKANGKGIVSITQKRKHPFGKPGVDFSKSYPVTSTPLYTTPPQRKPLTAMEVYDVVHDADLDWHTGFALGEDENRFVVFARAIEAAHGIKGEA